MIEIGKFNRLNVLREKDFGFFLDGCELGDILLPIRYAPEQCCEGSDVDVFIYRDSEDRLIATTERPYAEVGEFALMQVKDVTEIGAFLDWGLMKDLFVPFAEQLTRLKKGSSYIVRVLLDESTQRIIGSVKLNSFLSKETCGFEVGDSVDILIYKKTDLGYRVIVNNLYWGMLFNHDVFRPMVKGMLIKGFVKNIREDGKLDLCLQKEGYGKISLLSAELLEVIKEHNGFLPLTDKSEPSLIYDSLGMSKKTFKKAIGALYKKQLVMIEPTGVRLA